MECGILVQQLVPSLLATTDRVSLKQARTSHFSSLLEAYERPTSVWLLSIVSLQSILPGQMNLHDSNIPLPDFTNKTIIE